jgi:hypothetical protein
MENALAAALAGLGEKARSLHIPHEKGVQAGQSHLGRVLACNELNPHSAGQAQNRISPLDGAFGGFKEFVLALALDSAVLYLDIRTFLGCTHSQQRGKNLGLLVTSLVTHGHTGVAAENQDFLIAGNHFPNVVNGFLLAHNHGVASPFRFAPRKAAAMGEGPSILIFSVNWVQISAHRGPIAAERLNISTLAGSMRMLSSSLAIRFTRFLACVFPSRK